MEDTLKVDIADPLEIQLHLLSIAYFYGDYSIIHHFTNRNSPIFTAMTTGDIHALKKFAAKNEINFDQLSDEDKERFNQFHQKIVNEYKSQLKATSLPLPEEYLEALAARAVQLGNFATAHSALQVINKLEKKVNELLVSGVQLLQSKEVKSGSNETATEQLRQSIKQSAELFYKAIRIKKPLGNQFQYLSYNLYFNNNEALRKYYKYVEMNLIKEIIEFSIQYLTDDKVIADKIIGSLYSGKLRKIFLRYFAEIFSLGDANYQNFIDRYKEATKLLKQAKQEEDFLDIQKTLLGRGTGDNEYYQFLRELAVDHPISTLLVTIVPTPDDIPVIAPIILKSGVSLLEFLELDK